MKQKTLLHFWLLLCLMVAGATSAWADDITYTFTSKSWEALVDSKSANWNSGKDAGGFGNDGVQVTTTYTGANATSPVSFDNISKIVVTYHTNKAAGAGSFEVKIGTNNATSQDVGFSGDKDGRTTDFTSEFTYNNPQSGAVKLTVNTTTNSIYVVSVKITYSPADPGLSNSDLALTDAPVALNFDLYNNSSAQVINYTTSSTGAVTIPESDYANFAIDEDNKTITVTPKAVTPAAQTITVSQAADESYKAGSATFTVSITDSTPIPTHTATFSVNGEASSPVEYEEGASIEFPEDPADVDGKVFVGWATATINGTTDKAPEFVTEATMEESDVTFYAVFAEKSVVSGNVTKSYGFETVLSDDDDWINTGITRANGEANSGSYSGCINTNNTYLTFKDKVNVTEFSFAFKRTSTNNNYNVYIETSTDNSTWTAAETYAMSSFNNGSYLTKTKTFDGKTAYYVRFHCYNTTAVRYVDDVSITYKGETVSYSGYCTTVAADIREEAGISFAEAEVTKEIFENYAGQELTNPNDLPIKWTSSDEDVATVENGVVTMKAVGETIITASFDGNGDYKKATVSYTLTIQDSREAIELAFAEESVNVNVGNTVEAPELTGNAGGASVSYKSDDDDIATVDKNGIVTGVADGTTTITATVEATNEYKGGTATFTVTVIDPTKPGSLNNPYTVAQAIDAIDNSGDVTDVYAKGVVSKIVTALNATYGNITYDISDDGKTSGNQLRAYRGKSYDGAKFKSAAELQVGDTVVIRGDLVYYSNDKVYEFTQDNQLVSLVRNFELNEDDGYAGTVEVTGHISIDRTINAGKWSTIVLPYTMDELPSFITVRKFTGSTYADGCVTLNFDEATSIEANVPCMFKSDYAFINIKPADDKAVVVYPASELQNVETEYADMIATYAAKELPEGVFFISNNTWYEVAENQAAHMKAFRAYFVLHDIPAEARIMAIGLENEATEIKAIENGQLVIGNGAVYDLSGRRIEKPARGLYIVNGKKVVIK